MIPSLPEVSLERCKRLTIQLDLGVINIKEYAENITYSIVAAPHDEMIMCIEIIPDKVIPYYLDYLQSLLEPVDFMPYPGPFLVGKPLEDEITKIKLQLRAKYILLLDSIKKKKAAASTA